ncbi:hypothetical protein [Dokdonia sp. Hel_I_53]|uniref:hypothetical protein n=1 Tax=Dokdonia sp. Hel_I_53 TaxID=1566287 RepID=UPI00119CFE59|nr:hypothetical protein [Dokdonia sp. Hel_I_53]
MNNVLLYIPSLFEVCFVVGGVLLVFIIGLLTISYTKYGGGNSYGGNGNNDGDWDGDDFDI